MPSASSAASSRGIVTTCFRRCCRRSTASSSGCEAGIDVADIGCGAGGAVLLMAEAFPREPLRRLRHLAVCARAGRAAPGRVRTRPTCASSIPASSRCPTTGRYEFDHDVRLHPRHDRPAGMIDAIRRGAGAASGTWLLVDIKARDTFAENVAQEPDGAVDVRHQRAVVHVVGDVVARRRRPRHARPSGRQGMALAPGSPVPQLDVDHSINAFYESGRLTRSDYCSAMSEPIELDDVKAFAAGLSPWAHLARRRRRQARRGAGASLLGGRLCWVMIGTTR